MQRRSVIQTTCRSLNPRRQLVYRLTHCPIEVVQFLSVRPPNKGLTDIGTVQPELDVILFIDHGFLVSNVNRKLVAAGGNVL
jgi:hypothetical protein